MSSLVPDRVRKRREERGISGADLARRVGVSPAYVSQIEKGLRVPDVPVAVRIARVLEDDEALYVAWCRDHKARSRTKTPSAEPVDAWTRLYRTERFDDDRDFERTVASGKDIPPATPSEVLFSQAHRAETLPPTRALLLDSADEAPGTVETLRDALRAREARAGRSLVTAPVLEPGKDPGEREEIPRQLRVDEMVIDPRLLSAPIRGRPFVFRADEEVSRRVRDRVEPGDLVIVSRDLDDRAPEPGRVYVLRREGRVFLARLARFGDRFLVQPGPGETDMVDVGLSPGGPPKPAIAGEVVAVVRG
ncbi:MAG TPA: XRE family transcriptional regulator [Anaeromyxobacteraceae bacterium]|nr:XRE family transcriptional regulator [Anaeromyxobacteraceae bacterium]